MVNWTVGIICIEQVQWLTLLDFWRWIAILSIRIKQMVALSWRIVKGKAVTSHIARTPRTRFRYGTNQPNQYCKNKQLNITTTSLCNRVFTTQSSLFNFALFLRPGIKHGNHGNLLFRMILWCMGEFLSTLTETCTYLTPDQARTRGHRMSQCKIWHQRWPQTAQLPLRESHLSSWLLAPRIANIFQREWPEEDLLKLHCQNLMARPKRWEKRPYFHLIQCSTSFSSRNWNSWSSLKLLAFASEFHWVNPHWLTSKSRV